ncbi:hypothetical protein ABFG93_20920 [Pseudalkalibacillus hwajinpoensis]
MAEIKELESSKSMMKKASEFYNEIWKSNDRMVEDRFIKHTG